MSNNFANNLKRLRLSSGFTQEQAAQKLNISAKSVSRWECGSTMPDVMMLPEIARLYCVTIDDLYKEKPIAYENYAHRLMSVFEATHNISDFMNAENEYSNLIKNGKYTMKDLCMYGILYQFFMQDCKMNAVTLFDKGLKRGIDDDKDTYHWIERQKMLLYAQTGENDRNICEQTEKYNKNPDELYNNINLLVAYMFADDNQNALNLFEKAEEKFKDSAILYIYGGDLYRRLKMYDKAMDCWDKSIEIDNSFTAAMWSKADCYEEIGDNINAEKVWLEIIKWHETKGYDIEAQNPRMRLEKCRERL